MAENKTYTIQLKIDDWFLEKLRPEAMAWFINGESPNTEASLTLALNLMTSIDTEQESIFLLQENFGSGELKSGT